MEIGDTCEIGDMELQVFMEIGDIVLLTDEKLQHACNGPH